MTTETSFLGAQLDATLDLYGSSDYYKDCGMEGIKWVYRITYRKKMTRLSLLILVSETDSELPWYP